MHPHPGARPLRTCLLVGALLLPTSANAQSLPGGDPALCADVTACAAIPETIPKYVLPLVIPPVMKQSGAVDKYDIAVRQFQQQILPGGIWNSLNGRTDAFPPTPVWSYGPFADPVPAVAPDPGSQFNYPAYTIETVSQAPVAVRWRNELVAIDPATGFPCDGVSCPRTSLEHLLPVDQTLHWANPPAEGCRDGSDRTDCATNRAGRYQGPVPIVTHVHGAHVDAHSDGYPEAWWLPAANDIPPTYARTGSVFDDATGTNPGNLGWADYLYRQDQPATTLWYHDHSLGMTRSNVYAGPAGFWLIRGGLNDVVLNQRNGKPAQLPGPAPLPGQTVLQLNVPGDPVRTSVREIPIVIQDRSFNADGSLFYPDNRAFFEGLNVPEAPPQFPGAPELRIDFVPDSDIAPIWNPEAFFNVMVVNGVAWPTLEVAPTLYRFRLLNGCNSRFLNLALKYTELVSGDPAELPFVQIGAEQGFLPLPVEVLTGFATPILDGKKPRGRDRVPAPDPQQALLMTLAERADVIVDFSDLPDGTVITMTNTAPDAPFGGFPDVPADPVTTGQVMQFVVNSQLLRPADDAVTSPYLLLPAAETALGPVTGEVRQVSLNEGESEEVCVAVDPDGNLVQVAGSPPACPGLSVPFAPKEALLGTVDLTNPALPGGIPLKWTDTTGASTPVEVTLQSGAVLEVNVTENPILGDVEDWEIYNFTVDAHPIHLHLVRFQVMDRRPMPGAVGVSPVVQPWEAGFKDTVIAYPGEITTVRAAFDVEGLYVWHCHIVEHEDNEMMRPYVVSPVAP